MNKLYRVYTEDKNRETTEETIKSLFSGFTLYQGLGFWKGEKEKSLVIEIIAEDNSETRENLLALGLALKRHNQQENVYLVESKILTDLI